MDDSQPTASLIATPTFQVVLAIAQVASLIAAWIIVPGTLQGMNDQRIMDAYQMLDQPSLAVRWRAAQTITQAGDALHLFDGGCVFMDPCDTLSQYSFGSDNTPAVFRDIKTDMVNFEGGEFRNVTFDKGTFRGVHFTDTVMRDISFSEVDLYASMFMFHEQDVARKSSITVTGGKLEGTTFQAPDLSIFHIGNGTNISGTQWFGVMPEDHSPDGVFYVVGQEPTLGDGVRIEQVAEYACGWAGWHDRLDEKCHALY